MPEPAVYVRGLVKKYPGDVVAVAGIDLEIGRGETFGLLGPNGAGKSTTLRMLLGLVRPTHGVIRVLGLPAGDAKGLARTGAMADTAFFPFLSGRDNLRAIGRRTGVGDRRVDEVVDRVSLSARARSPYGTYSLGMKQRLSVAAALLKDPELLILDEPSNGLDPAGQLDMRRLIRELGHQGRTIIVSTHDMAEAEELCDRVAVIGAGRLLAVGTPLELRGAQQLTVQATPTGVATRLIQTIVAHEAEVVGGRVVVEVPSKGFDPAAVTHELVGAGVDVHEIHLTRKSLRRAFLEVTGGRTGGPDSVRTTERGLMAARVEGGRLARWMRRSSRAGGSSDHEDFET
jgi:ABC-2 type transport system ATP-binding protein